MNFEEDKDSKNKLYNDICDKLCELQLINIYNTEFDMLRRYQRVFYRMLTGSLVFSLEAKMFCMSKFFLIYKALHCLNDIKYVIKKIVNPFHRINYSPDLYL